MKPYLDTIKPEHKKKISALFDQVEKVNFSPLEISGYFKFINPLMSKWKHALLYNDSSIAKGIFEMLVKAIVELGPDADESGDLLTEKEEETLGLLIKVLGTLSAIKNEEQENE